MDVQAPRVFLRSFSQLADPRRHNVRHRFTDILAIAILAVMSRADDWEEVVLYGRANLLWLKEFLELPNGIPCADTFRRVFARLNPLAFERCFVEWTRSLASDSNGRLNIHTVLEAEWLGNNNGLELVKAERDPKDDRFVLLSLSKKGEHFVGALNKTIGG